MFELLLLGALFGGVVKYITSESDDDNPLKAATPAVATANPCPATKVDETSVQPAQAETTARVRAETAAALRAVVEHLENGRPIPSEVKHARRKIVGRVGILLHDDSDAG